MDSIDVVIAKDHIELDIEVEDASMTVTLAPNQTLLLAKKLEEAARAILNLHNQKYLN